MAYYGSIGTYLSAQEICADPFGGALRGLALKGSSFDHHVLIRRFSQELQDAGLGKRLASARVPCQKLGRLRGFGTGYALELSPTPLVAWDYIPGQSLAQTLAKAKQERVPFGIDQALYLVSGLSQSLLQLHEAGFHHGLLSPHSLWVSYEGTLHLVDAPYAAGLRELLPACPQLLGALADYQPPTPLPPVEGDLYSLGAILYETLTLEPLPRLNEVGALRRARLKASLEPDRPLPPELQSLIERLVLPGAPFKSLAEFCGEFSRILHDQEHAPTTFNVAFLMHNLFREELRLDEVARERDKVADYTPLVPGSAAPSKALLKQDRSNQVRWAIVGGLAGVGLVAATLHTLHAKTVEAEEAKAQLSIVQRELTQERAQLADINARERESRRREAELQREQAKARTQEEKARIQKALDEERQKTEALAQQRAMLARSQEQPQSRNPALAGADSVPTSAPKPGSTNAQPLSLSPAAVPAYRAPETAPDVEVPPEMTSRKAPAAPRLAASPVLQWLRNQNRDVHVVLRIEIDPGGQPGKVVVASGETRLPELVDASKRAALASTYQPATRSGKPVSGWITVDYNFEKPWLK